MRIRILSSALLTAASFGCGDDAGDELDGRRGADIPTMHARVADANEDDASEQDASAHTDAGDSGACLEASYLWSAVEECFGDGSGLLIARRVTLAELCADYDCPRDWDAALAVAGECDADADSGFDECWRTTTDCGADLLRSTRGPDGRLLYYDHATGELIGAAIQLTDIAEECMASELIAGERPPLCCDMADAGEDSSR